METPVYRLTLKADRVGFKGSLQVRVIDPKVASGSGYSKPIVVFFGSIRSIKDDVISFIARDAQLKNKRVIDYTINDLGSVMEVT